MPIITNTQVYQDTNNSLHNSPQCKPTPLQSLQIPSSLGYLENCSAMGVNTSLLAKICCSDQVTSSVKIYPNYDKSGAYNPLTSVIEIVPLRKNEQDNSAYISQQISTLVHELSHARDHLKLSQYSAGLMDRLGKGAEIDAIKALYKTELKAWVVEAMQCKLTQSAGVDMTLRMQYLLDSATAGINDVLNNPGNSINTRILNYKSQAGLPGSWDAQKVLSKTQLKEPLEQALTLIQTIELTTAEKVDHFINDLDHIFY